ncbi:MAG TPA: alpha/beta fold hydrolase [bacterium]|nr:alpha/beta fold hydrolase [bacterium]
MIAVLRPSPRLAPASAGLALLLSGAPSTHAQTAAEVTFASGDLTLAATITLPDGAGPFPAAVLVHGSGPSGRSNPWTSAWEEALVARGIAVLHPDKRGSGESEGDWRSASLLDLADDAAAAAAALRAHPGVDPTNVGLIGFSQGGHVVPVAATEDPDVAFAVSVSGSVVPMYEQIGDEVLLSGERDGLTAEELARVAGIHEASLRYIRTGEGWEAYATALRDAKGSGLAGRDVVERFPVDPDDTVWAHVRALGDLDPMEYWKRPEIPVLFAYGGRDERLRVSKSTARIQAELDPAGTNYVLLVFGPNGHGHVRDDQLDLIARWIRDRGVK